jgi:hypothetical protein
MKAYCLKSKWSYTLTLYGEPVAVVIDIALWRSILKQLEDSEDFEALRNVADDIAALTQGKKPAGWKTLDEFEAELDALEAAGVLPA